MSEAAEADVGNKKADQIIRRLRPDERVPDLERALLTMVIELKAVHMLLWMFDCRADGKEFSSDECRAAWLFMMGQRLVPTQEELLERFPHFRFVRAPFALLQLAERVFKRPRVFETPEEKASASPAPLPAPRRGSTAVVEFREARPSAKKAAAQVDRSHRARRPAFLGQGNKLPRKGA